MSEVLKINVYLPQEKEIVTNLERQMRGKLFIDVGAFIGEYSINLADNFEEVWEFEPATDARKCLEEARAKMHFGPGIFCRRRIGWKNSFAFPRNSKNIRRERMEN